MSKNSLPVIYTFEEAREILKTSKGKLRMLLNSGELKGFKIGKYNWRITSEDLENYLKKIRCS